MCVPAAPGRMKRGGLSRRLRRIGAMRGAAGDGAWSLRRARRRPRPRSALERGHGHRRRTVHSNVAPKSSRLNDCSDGAIAVTRPHDRARWIAIAARTPRSGASGMNGRGRHRRGRRHARRALAAFARDGDRSGAEPRVPVAVPSDRSSPDSSCASRDSWRAALPLVRKVLRHQLMQLLGELRESIRLTRHGPLDRSLEQIRCPNRGVHQARVGRELSATQPIEECLEFV